MKRILFSIICISSSLLARNLPLLFEMNLEDLGQIPLELSTVSNRYEVNLDQAANSVTIFTEEEIKRHGYKTLQELLNSVVGFDEGYHIFRSLVSNRGFRQDINSNYLLLIDGHRVNEDAFGGFGNAHIFPLMSNIAQVEVIRGPSSTLWGSSAINGIVAITTKSAEEYEESDSPKGAIHVSTDYEFRYKRRILNADYAKVYDHGESLISAQYFDNDVPWSYMYGYGVAELVPYKKPQAHYDFDPSYRIYAKITYDAWTLLINKSRYVNIPNNITYTTPPLTTNEKGVEEKSWIDLIYKTQLSDELGWESRIFYEDKTTTLKSYKTTGELYSHQIYVDRGVGAESLVRYTTLSYHLLGGIYAHRKHLEAANLPRRNIVTDKNLAVFAEYSYNGIDNWLFTIGGRGEYGSPRGDTHSFMPRFSVYWQAKEDMFVKYSYNSGALRPTLVTLRDYYYTSNDQTYYAKGADKTQTSGSHDLQIGYRGERLRWTLTLYYTRIKDLVLWGDQFQVDTIGDVPVLLWETNLADLEQKGIEFEWRYTLQKNLTVYGNYAYADTTYTDEWVEYNGQPVLSLIDDYMTDESLTMAGAPQHTWNVGIDWDITPTLSLNFHYRGRSDVLSIYPNPNWTTSGAEHFFDANLRWREVFGENTTLSAYVKNIGDNRGLFPTGYGVVETQLGRQIGIELDFSM